MADSVIEEMYQRVALWGHRNVSRSDLLRWAHHLHGEVLPKLEELEALKAEKQPAKAKREKATA